MERKQNGKHAGKRNQQVKEKDSEERYRDLSAWDFKQITSLYLIDKWRVYRSDWHFWFLFKEGSEKKSCSWHPSHHSEVQDSQESGTLQTPHREINTPAETPQGQDRRVWPCPTQYYGNSKWSLLFPRVITHLMFFIFGSWIRLAKNVLSKLEFVVFSVVMCIYSFWFFLSSVKLRISHVPQDTRHTRGRNQRCPQICSFQSMK